MWRSPLGVRDSSKFIATSGDSTSTWLDLYEGGWQTVLPAGGYPSNYKGADLGLHAEVNTIPWDCIILEDTVSKVSVKFSVRTYRTPFFFEKTLTLLDGSPFLQIDEVLVNEGEEVLDYIWGEHIALGTPFLSTDCVIDLPGGEILNHPEVDWHPNNRLQAGLRTKWPYTKDKHGEEIDLSKIPHKDLRVYDQSYILDMPEGWYAVTNQKLGIGWAVSYSTDVFKYLWYWQSLGGGFGYPFYGRTYNVGLEPFTGYTNQGLEEALKSGTASSIQPGERIKTSLKAIAYKGTERVTKVSSDGTVFR